MELCVYIIQTTTDMQECLSMDRPATGIVTGQSSPKIKTFYTHTGPIAKMRLAKNQNHIGPTGTN